MVTRHEMWLEDVERISFDHPDETLSIEEKAGFPPIEHIDFSCIPPMAEEIIEGVLRKGHKMILTGPSKAGKTFLLIALSVAVATGDKWLDRQCRQGRVLYCNLEVDRSSFLHRLAQVAGLNGSSQIPHKTLLESSLDVWNLRGKIDSFEKFVELLIEAVNERDYDLVVLDPIYKLMAGSENESATVVEFSRLVDKIAEKGCSVVYAHHHPKGNQAARSAIDRGSGSGVFARDADALVDLIELDRGEIAFPHQPPGATAWRVSMVLREFANPEPIEIWWQWPRHVVDSLGVLSGCKPQFGAERKIPKTSCNRRAKNVEKCEEALMELFSGKKPGEPVLRKELMESLGVNNDKTVNGWVDESKLFDRTTEGPGGRAIIVPSARQDASSPKAF